jgi:hypothetical protein
MGGERGGALRVHEQTKKSGAPDGAAKPQQLAIKMVRFIDKAC